MKKIVLLFISFFYGILLIAQTASVEGYVYSKDDSTAIKNAHVEITVYELYSDKTDGNGRYEINNIQLGEDSTRAKISISKKDYQTTTDSITLFPDDNFLDTVYLEKVKSSISGTVELVGGWGDVEEVELILSGDGQDTTNPDQDGKYEFIQLDPGDYTVVVSHPNYITEDKEVELEEDPVVLDFTLQPIPGSISGYVTITPMELVNQVKITLNDLLPGITPDETGFYVFETAEPGSYIIEASFNGYVSDTMYDQLLEPGDTLENLNFTMQSDFASINGYVKNEQDKPIENAIVFAESKSDTTDSSGLYQIVGLQYGKKIDITAMAPGYKDKIYTDTILNQGLNQIHFILESKPLIIDSIPNDNILRLEPTLVDSISILSKFYVGGINLDTTLFINSMMPFEISLIDTDTAYTTQLKIEPVSGIVDTTEVYVRFKPTDAVDYQDVIILSSTGADNSQIPVEGLGIEQLQATINSSKDIICAGKSVLLKAIVSGGLEGTYTYAWVVVDTIISTGSVVVVTPAAKTTYSLIVSDILGNVDTTDKTISIYETPAITSNPENDTICTDGIASFSIELDDDFRVVYQWEGKVDTAWMELKDSEIYDGAETNELIVNGVEASMNGYLYRCTYSRCDNSESSYSAELIVRPSPSDTLIIKGNPPTVLISPDSGQIYQWYKDGDSLIGENGQFFYPPGGFESGSEYYAEITSSDYGCYTKTDSYIAGTQKNSIVVYPNPVSDKLHIDFSGYDEESYIRLSIRDLLGRTIIESKIPDGDIKKSLSLGTLKNGLYIVEIKDERGSVLYSSKIIKN